MKVRGTLGFNPHPCALRCYQLTKEAGPRRRLGPGLNEELLSLVLHQMHILTDLLERHLWDSRALGSIAVTLPGAQVSVRRPGSLGNGSMRNRQCPKRVDHEKGDMGEGYSLEQEAQAPQHHPHCYHWRSQGYGEDRGTSEGQLHRVLWGWSCAQAAARRKIVG